MHTQDFRKSTLASGLLAIMLLAACGDSGGATAATGGDGGSGDGGSSGNGDGGSNGDPTTGTQAGPGSTSGSNSASGSGSNSASASGSTGPGPGTTTGGGGEGGEGQGGEGQGPVTVGGGFGGEGQGGEGPGQVTVGGGFGGEGGGGNIITSASVTTGGPDCLDEPFFLDPECDTCAQSSCCDEIEACLADPDLCFDVDGAIDPSTLLGDDLLTCLESSCTEECTGGGICDSGVGYNDPQIDACLSDACCSEYSICTEGGSDIDACIACFEDGGGVLCDDAILCTDDSGCVPVDGCLPDEFQCESDGACIPGDWICDTEEDCADGSDEANCAAGVCDSGVTYGDPAIDGCLGDNCCVEYNDCTADGTDPQPCIDCLNAGGGALCDDAIECDAFFGCTGEPTGICTSGISTGDPEVDECAGTFCCDEFNACTDDGADVDACIACFENPNGGPLCDPAIECFDDNLCGG